MVKRLLRKLGYLEEEPQYFLSKRICGIWLIWVSVVILIGTFFGGSQEINMIIFNIGYFLGFILILGNKRVHNKFAFGPPSTFQNNMTLLSIVLMFVLLIGMGGQFFATQNYRMIWLSAFLAIGIHFFPFSAVHGKIMLPLAILVSLNAILGMIFSSIQFSIFAYIDVFIKALFGIIMFLSKNPLKKSITTSVEI